MTRSQWKMPYAYTKHTDQIKFTSRSSKILPQFVGSAFSIHNGRNHTEIIVTEKMVNCKFGEFSFTRSKFIFKKKKKKKK